MFLSELPASAMSVKHRDGSRSWQRGTILSNRKALEWIAARRVARQSAAA